MLYSFIANSTDVSSLLRNNHYSWLKLPIVANGPICAAKKLCRWPQMGQPFLKEILPMVACGPNVVPETCCWKLRMGLLVQPMFCHGLCHWYSQPTPESYVIDTPANVGRCLDSYIVDMSADAGWAKDLRCIQRAIQCPVGWHLDCLVCIGVYCWTRKLCSVAFQWYNMDPCTLCRP